MNLSRALGRPSDAGANFGKITIGVTMQPVEVQTVVNGETRSVAVPSLHQPRPGTSPGPDVIVGDLPAIQQFGSAGTQVGLRSQQLRAMQEPKPWIGSHCRKPIIQSFHKICIE